jgi:hypothetical protein
LKNRSNYSTITLYIDEIDKDKEVEKSSFMSKAQDSLVKGWDKAVVFVFLVMSNWFAIVFSLGVVYFVRRKIKK